MVKLIWEICIIIWLHFTHETMFILIATTFVVIIWLLFVVDMTNAHHYIKLLLLPREYCIPKKYCYIGVN